MFLNPSLTKPLFSFVYKSEQKKKYVMRNNNFKCFKQKCLWKASEKIKNAKNPETLTFLILSSEL